MSGLFENKKHAFDNKVKDYVEFVYNTKINIEYLEK